MATTIDLPVETGGFGRHVVADVIYTLPREQRWAGPANTFHDWKVAINNPEIVDSIREWVFQTVKEREADGYVNVRGMLYHCFTGDCSACQVWDKSDE